MTQDVYMARKVFNPATAAALRPLRDQGKKQRRMRSREFLALAILEELAYGAVTCGKGSPEWTRTTNPAINSRMLCQLSYGGPIARWRRGAQYLIGGTHAYGRVDPG